MKHVLIPVDLGEECSFKHDNLDRFYYIYTPNNIDTNESIPYYLPSMVMAHQQ